jgi:transposase
MPLPPLAGPAGRRSKQAPGDHARHPSPEPRNTRRRKPAIRVIERTLAWLTGYRRLTLRYERNASHFLAFLTFAATITCYKKLTKHAT